MIASYIPSANDFIFFFGPTFSTDIVLMDDRNDVASTRLGSWKIPGNRFIRSVVVNRTKQDKH